MILAVIEKGSVGELALGLSLIFGFLFAVNRILKWSEKRRTKPLGVWPTLFQVSCADSRAIERWRKELPAPVSIAQHVVINEISHRYLFYNGFAYMDSPRPTEKTMTCPCGHKHPFVHAFGKCGTCMETKRV